ncbi:MAG: maleate cis-trans isomerase [Nitrososphaeria archaeon]|nr:maleate cis-trans isomerase [Nitrososphaeria archaeon]NIN52075.1 maleate cis-trans isomerase [Nitrososphaeria archaeon]NIQ32535.1 maleate cis-trans isomerase [Nitrososphaeria archaeon]
MAGEDTSEFRPKFGSGWRAKLGILVPSVNYVMEPEFNMMAPEGVSIHTARMKKSRVHNAETLVLMAEEAEREAELLGHVADVIGFGCTSGSFVKGREWGEELTKRIEEAAGVPATTTSVAMCEALREVDIRKLSLATPYPDETNRLEKRFLEENGFEVLSMKGLGCEVSGPQGEYPPQVAYQLGKEVDVDEADGVFISCTNFRSVEIIEGLERDLCKPVVSSNSATMWKLLKMAAVRGAIDGYGELLRKL